MGPAGTTDFTAKAEMGRHCVQPHIGVIASRDLLMPNFLEAKISAQRIRVAAKSNAMS
jgi:hypothetical protein